MMRLLSLSLFACLCLVLAACGSRSAERPNAPSFDDVTQHAVAALSRSGQVFHAVETVTQGGQSRTDEVWLDMEYDVARVSEGGRLRVFHDGKIAELTASGRLEDADIWQTDIDKTSALALSHISPLFSGSIEATDVQVSDEGGRTTYRLEVETEWNGDWSGTEKFEIDLDGQFLPISVTDRVEGAGPEDREIDTEVKWDFVPRSSLPAGFVSLDAVKAVVVTPLDDMKRATENGLKLYWLGETFETEPLKDFAPPWGETPAELTYGHDDPLSDPVLITVDEYTPQGWSEHAGDHRCQGWRSLPSETETAVSGFEATFCELAWMSAPPPAQGGEGDSEGFTPTAPNDDCVIRQLIIHFPDSVVVVSSGSGLCGTNPYGNRGELLRLGASLRPFEAPTP